MLRTRWPGRPQWVLPRAECRFARIELAGVPAAGRARALELQLRQWSPFANSGHYVVWQEEAALVWTWDADRAGQTQRDEGYDPARLDIIPETLLQAPGDSLRLVACLEGCESQFWRDGALVASRWWPVQPGGGEWIDFQRDAGLQGPDRTDAIPAPAALPLQARPWARSERNATAARAGAIEGWTLFFGALLLFAFVSWETVRWIKAERAIAERKTELAAAESAARPLREARRAALDDRQRAQALLDLNPYPDQLALLAQIAAALPGGAYLREWDYQHGRLRFSLSSPNNIPGQQLVGQLQGGGWFKDVQAVAASPPADLAFALTLLPAVEVRQVPAAENSLAATDGPGQERP